MSFKEALVHLHSGKKIKRKSWTGYWKKAKDASHRDTIFMFCKDGRIMDIKDTEDLFFTLSNILSDDWVVLD